MLSYRRLIDNVLIFLGLIIFYFAFANTDLSKKLTKHLYGGFVSGKVVEESVDDVAIITIDEHSIHILGKAWPWPRSYHASMLELLTKAKAKAIGYSVLFLESEEHDRELLNAFRQNNKIALPIKGYSKTEAQTAFDPYVHFGHNMLEAGTDGILRDVQLYAPDSDYELPSFALAVLGLVDPTLEGFYKARSFRQKNALYFLFGENSRFKKYSFADVLTGKIPLSEFEDKVVFVGTTLSGVSDKFIPIYRDKFRSFTGVDIQAHLFESLRSKNFVEISTPRIQTIINLLLLMMILLLTRETKLSPVMTNIMGIGIIAASTGVSYVVFQFTNYWVSLIDGVIVAIVYLFFYSVVAMQYRLKEANKMLEAHVEKRTQELKVTNYNLAQEIQERKTIELSLRNNEHDLRVLLDSLQIGIMTIDHTGKIITANRTIFLILATTYRKFVGQNINNILTYSEAKGQASIQAYELISYLEEGSSSSVQLEGNILGAEETIPVAITFSKVTQGEKDKFVCLIRDIRDQLRAEKITQEFVATVSHELRTPITSVKGALELISSGATGKLTPKTQNLLSIAVRNSNRLLTLVNDILDTQRMQLGTLEFHLVPLNLVELIEQSIEVNESYVQTYNATIVTQLPPYPIYVMGDYERLIQVMNNLISNAAKFSHSGEAVIDIRVVIDKRNARVEVIDYGQGVSDHFKSEIFKKFAQADDAKHRSQGTGLGLSITKALIERMSGNIDFYSEEGKGATFFFTLPILNVAEHNISHTH